MALFHGFLARAGQNLADLDRRYHWIGLGLIACVTLALAVHLCKNTKYKYPNPIPGIPFFGNSFQMPSKSQGPYMTTLARKSGDM